MKISMIMIILVFNYRDSNSGDYDDDGIYYRNDR